LLSFTTAVTLKESAPPRNLMNNSDSNGSNNMPSTPEWSPDQLRSIYARLREGIDPSELEKEYQALSQHPEHLVLFEDLIKELQGDFEADRKEAG
jgi:hypothetical protein